MVNWLKRNRFFARCGAVLAIAAAVAGCDRNAAEMAQLKADNEHLRTELANLRRKMAGGGDAEPATGKPDLTLPINDLWTQRFEDNEFRARQRLSDKALRVTGLLDGVSGETVSLYGVGKARNVRMNVNLERSYAANIQNGLAALEKGVTITVQGKFIYDRMELSDATIVNQTTGAPLTTDQLQAFGQPAPPEAPAPTAGNP